MQHVQRDTIYGLFIDYLNIIGLSLPVSVLICLGLSMMYPQKKMFHKKMIFGLAFVLIGIMLFVTKIPLFFQWPK